MSETKSSSTPRPASGRRRTSPWLAANLIVIVLMLLVAYYAWLGPYQVFVRLLAVARRALHR